MTMYPSGDCGWRGEREPRYNKSGCVIGMLTHQTGILAAASFSVGIAPSKDVTSQASHTSALRLIASGK